MIQAVPAFEISSGTFACVMTGAIAIADGENTTPTIILTLSLVISSVATVLAAEPDGGPSSRLMTSIVCGAISLAWSLI